MIIQRKQPFSLRKMDKILFYRENSYFPIEIFRKTDKILFQRENWRFEIRAKRVLQISHFSSKKRILSSFLQKSRLEWRFSYVLNFFYVVSFSTFPGRNQNFFFLTRKMSGMANLKHSLCSYFKTPIRDNFSLQKRILSSFLEISIGKQLKVNQYILLTSIQMKISEYQLD